MMRLKQRHTIFALLAIHLCIALYTFWDMLAYAKEAMLCKWGDGMRAYFVLQSYVNDKSGIGHIHCFNYPYGDSVLYADIVPLFAVPYKWFCLHVTDISLYVIPAFNLFFVLSIVLCGLLVYYVFSYLLKERSIAFIMAVVLPWANVQLVRVWKGQYSLSFSSLVLLLFCVLVLWDKHRADRKKLRWLSAGAVLLCVVSFFVQPYYLAVFSVVIIIAFPVYGWLTRQYGNGGFTMLAGCMIPVVSMAICYWVMCAAVPGASQRLPDFTDPTQKTVFGALYTSYFFYSIFFPFKYELLAHTEDPDKMAYLGNIALLLFAVIAIAVVVNRSYRREFIQQQKTFFSSPLAAALISGTGICLFVSFGELYKTADDGYAIYNLLDPFFYLHLVTHQTEHFNKLARFAWPFYWAFNIWILYTAVAAGRNRGKTLMTLLTVFLVVTGAIEVKAHLHMLKARMMADNPLRDPHHVYMNSLHVDYSNYQAILPLPYYHTGSEEEIYTLPEEDGWATFTYQLSLHSGLPLMSSKLNRTKHIQVVSLFSLVCGDALAKELGQVLNDKPVLVAYNKKLAADTSLPNIPKDATAKAYYRSALALPERKHLQVADTLGDVVFYTWYPAKVAGKP